MQRLRKQFTAAVSAQLDELEARFERAHQSACPEIRLWAPQVVHEVHQVWLADMRDTTTAVRNRASYSAGLAERPKRVVGQSKRGADLMLRSSRAAFSKRDRAMRGAAQPLQLSERTRTREITLVAKPGSSDEPCPPAAQQEQPGVWQDIPAVGWRLSVGVQRGRNNNIQYRPPKAMQQAAAGSSNPGVLRSKPDVEKFLRACSPGCELQIEDFEFRAAALRARLAAHVTRRPQSKRGRAGGDVAGQPTAKRQTPRSDAAASAAARLAQAQ